MTTPHVPGGRQAPTLLRNRYENGPRCWHGANVALRGTGAGVAGQVGGRVLARQANVTQGEMACGSDARAQGVGVAVDAASGRMRA